MPSDTIRARGVSYHVRGRLRVAPHADGAPSTLTIEPGVTLRFDDVTNDSGLQLGTSDVRQGILVAAGTAAQKITFTSAKATPAAAAPLKNDQRTLATKTEQYTPLCQCSMSATVPSSHFDATIVIDIAHMAPRQTPTVAADIRRVDVF